MKPRLLFAAALMLATVPAAQAYELRFTGPSRTTPALKRDVLNAITGYSKYTYKCSFIFSVESAQLPPSYVPRTPLYQIAAPQHSYERWLINLCGKKRSFLLGLWPAPQGGANFKVLEVPPGIVP